MRHPGCPTSSGFQGIHVGNEAHDLLHDGSQLYSYETQGFVDEQTGACRLNRILVAVDRDPDPTPAVRLAAQLATALDSHACEIRLLHLGTAEELPTIKIPTETQLQFKWVTRTGHAVPEFWKRRSHSPPISS